MFPQRNAKMSEDVSVYFSEGSFEKLCYFKQEAESKVQSRLISSLTCFILETISCKHKNETDIAAIGKTFWPGICGRIAEMTRSQKYLDELW